MRRVYNLVHLGKVNERTEAVQSLNIKVLLHSSISLSKQSDDVLMRYRSILRSDLLLI